MNASVSQINLGLSEEEAWALVYTIERSLAYYASNCDDSYNRTCLQLTKEANKEAIEIMVALCNRLGAPNYPEIIFGELQDRTDAE